jgi:hypothetical protein
MTEEVEYYGSHPIEACIRTMRGQKVILASDLAEVYGVKTKRLNEAVKRNVKRFPADFLFRLTADEARAELNSRSQFATLKQGYNIKYLPYAFTEHGAVMAANVLNSPRAVQMSVFVVRAFVHMRGLLGDTRQLARRLAALEKELKARLDVHDAAIVDVLQRIMNLIDPPLEPEPPRKQLGFSAREAASHYTTRRKKP